MADADREARRRARRARREEPRQEAGEGGDGQAASVEVFCKILVVDDEPDLEHLMRQRLRRDVRRGSLELVFAHDGVHALEILESDRDIDMVLSDINMPRMDGLTLLEQIPSVDPNIRSVIVSAYGDMKNIRTAMNRGAFDFVTKPIDFADLRITIDKTRRHLAMLREALATRDKLVAVQNELSVAHKLQQSVLPTEFPERLGCAIFGNMEPAKDVGGDFFDVITLERGRVGLAVADVSGKGVSAALFMMQARTLLKGAAIGHPRPGAVLAEINALLEEDNEAAMFVTFFYGVFDPATGVFVYANGGHNPPVVVAADGGCAQLPLTGGIALGLMPGLEYEEAEATLGPGDTVVLYTDGVSEAMNAQNEEFGMERLEAVFADQPAASAEEATGRIFEAVRQFAGDTPQSDDITCLTLMRAET